MDTGYDDDARVAVTQARYRLRNARYFAAFAPDIHARVVGELSLARELLTKARNAVDDWLALETARGVIDTLDE